MLQVSSFHYKNTKEDKKAIIISQYQQMQIFSKSLIKPRGIQEQSLLVLLIKDIGKGSFIECQAFQDIQIKTNKTKTQQQDNEQQEFYLEADGDNQFQQVQKEKKDQFNKFINIEERKVQNKGNKDPPNLQIQSFNCVYGANKGNYTVQLIEGRICRAVGVNIFIDNLIIPPYYSAKQGHVYDVNYLRYDTVRQVLYSGASDGKKSEVIQWKFNAKEKNLLSFQKKITLPQSCLSIFSIFAMKNQLICITKCSIQRQSQLLKLQLDSNSSLTKMKCQLKLGKIVNILIGPTIYIVNENGLSKLTQTLEIIPLYKNNQSIISLQSIDQQNILLGLMNGSIIIFNSQFGKVLSEYKLSNSRTIIIKALTKNQFAAVTNKQQLILFEIDSSFKQYKVLQKIKLEDSCTNILFNKKTIFCILQKGKIQQFTLVQKNLKKTTDKIEDKFNFGSIPNNQTQIKQIIFNKQLQKFIYFFPKSTQLTLFQNDKSKMKNITQLKLTHPFQFLDTYGNIIASICGEDQKQLLQIFDLVKNKSILIQNKLPFPQCTCIKFNPAGDRLALGFGNGQTVIFNTKNIPILKQLCKSQLSKKPGLFHKTAVQNIIWNEQGNAIKTFSQYNLLYYLLFNKNDQYSLFLYFLQNKKKVQGFEEKIKKAEWTQMGKFNYKNSKLMDRYQQVIEYNQLKQTKDYIFASQFDGIMKIFNNPIKEKDKFQSLRWFRQPYKYLIIEDNNNAVTMLIHCRNIIFSVNLKMKGVSK